MNAFLLYKILFCNKLLILIMKISNRSLKKSVVLCIILALAGFSSNAQTTADSTKKPCPQKAEQSQPVNADIIAPNAPAPDDPDFAAKKLEWIKNHPEEYRAKGGNPEDVIIEFNKRENKTPEVKTYSSPVDITDTSLYKLVSVDALDIYNRHTAAEMEIFKKEASEEPIRMNIVIDWEKQRWYYIPRNIEKKPRLKEFTIADNQILFTDCKECEDNKFTIIAKTSRSLILQLKLQDEGHFFVYQLEFKK
jgi:hypothetical protein